MQWTVWCYVENRFIALNWDNGTEAVKERSKVSKDDNIGAVLAENLLFSIFKTKENILIQMFECLILFFF